MRCGSGSTGNARQKYCLICIAIGLAICGLAVKKMIHIGTLKESQLLMNTLSYRNVRFIRQPRGGSYCIFELDNEIQIRLNESLWKEKYTHDHLVGELNEGRQMTIWRKSSDDSEILGLKTEHVFIDPRYGIETEKKKCIGFMMIGAMFVISGFLFRFTR